MKNFNRLVETDAISGCCSTYKAHILKNRLGEEDFFMAQRILSCHID